MYNPYDYYFKKAKNTWYKARSVFKLEEIDKKFNIFNKNVKTVLDIGCNPGSWTQYSHQILTKNWKKDFKIIGFDISVCNLNLENVHIYKQDITDFHKASENIKKTWIRTFDVIMSDMAPNTTGIKDIDTIKCIWLLESSLPIYEHFLAENWKFIIKIFMWPWFEEFLKNLKKTFWEKSIKTYKPSSTRKQSKEIYIIKK